jgi:hypothetical protein
MVMSVVGYRTDNVFRGKSRKPCRSLATAFLKKLPKRWGGADVESPLFEKVRALLTGNARSPVRFAQVALAG